MDPWTPAVRDEFIHAAVNSTVQKGHRGPYNYRVYPKLGGSDMDDPKRSAVTEALARVVFEKNPRYKEISLKFYEMLVDKIRTSVFVNKHFMSNFYILLKGSTAYRMLLGDAYKDEFHYSDLDAVIYINPYVEVELFNSLKTALTTILLQVMSQYKRLVDQMLFLNKPPPEAFWDAATIEGFKQDVNAEFASISGFDGQFMSPFENDGVRNSCSKNSFIITNSVAQANSVVRVEVPHFDRCERIPLRKTPLMTSYNSTISFNRANNHGGADVAEDAPVSPDMVGAFDLFRFKLNCLFVGLNENEDDMVENKIPADFIDISIASRNDAELIHFWNHGRCINHLVRDVNTWVVIPDLVTCMSDLYKMLYVYECPEHKKEKRLARYNIIKKLLDNQAGIVQ